MAEGWIDSAAGWAAGAASTAAVQPLDTLLTRRQAGVPNAAKLGGAGGAVRALGGVRGLWRGTLPLVAVRASPPRTSADDRS